jgi:hypothetical protein
MKWVKTISWSAVLMMTSKVGVIPPRRLAQQWWHFGALEGWRFDGLLEDLVAARVLVILWVFLTASTEHQRSQRVPERP